MDCHSVSEDLSAYLDGELGADAVAAIEDHFSSCRTCRTELMDLRKLVSVLRGLPRMPAPPGTLQAVAEQTGLDPF